MMKNTIKTMIIAAALAVGAQQAGANELWGKHCASCHGKDGKGQTKAGQKAKVKDLTDAKHQESFDDAKAFKSIKNGLKDGDREQMKPFAEKLTDEQITALVAFTRTFVKK
jgi:mono/diheme cytochrome c family protein